MNRDGQLDQLLKIDYPEYAMRFQSVAFGDGLPASAKWVREGILAKYKKPVAAKAVSAAKKAPAKAKATKAVAASKSKKVASKKAAAKKVSSAKSKRK